MGHHCIQSYKTSQRRSEMSKIIFGFMVLLICIIAEDLRLQVEKDSSQLGFNKLQVRTGRETRAKQNRKLSKQKRGRKAKLERKRKEKANKNNRNRNNRK